MHLFFFCAWPLGHRERELRGNHATTSFTLYAVVVNIAHVPALLCLFRVLAFVGCWISIKPTSKCSVSSLLVLFKKKKLHLTDQKFLIRNGGNANFVLNYILNCTMSFFRQINFVGKSQRCLGIWRT